MDKDHADADKPPSRITLKSVKRSSGIDKQSKYFKQDPKSSSSTVCRDVSPCHQEPATSETGPENYGVKARLTCSFFEEPCEQLAKALLGKTVVKKCGSKRISGKIVETEAYLGFEDKAAHSYQGKRTNRNEAMFMDPGTAYVYNIYGMYCCFNISSAGEGCAVLVRALEPLEGLSTMHGRRSKSAKKVKESDLTSGPSKLCQALAITKDSCNKVDLTGSDELWLEEGEDVPEDEIVKCPRINIAYAEEWTGKPLRFYIKDSSCVSVKFKG